jgi:hypothetical protein
MMKYCIFLGARLSEMISKPTQLTALGYRPVPICFRDLEKKVNGYSKSLKEIVESPNYCPESPSSSVYFMRENEGE